MGSCKAQIATAWEATCGGAGHKGSAEVCDVGREGGANRHSCKAQLATVKEGDGLAQQKRVMGCHSKRG